MIKVDETNIVETKEFVVDNLKRSGFTYGNLQDPQAESYIMKVDEKIVAMANCLDSKYVTYLFPEGTNHNVIRKVLMFMSKKKHIGGTVTGDYLEIIKEFYEVPVNAINEVASISLENQIDTCTEGTIKLTVDDVEDYKKSIDTITQFPQRSKEAIEEAFKRSSTVGIKVSGEIVSAATLTAISHKTAVVVSVFTIPSMEGRGYATKCVARLLKDYGVDRTILIFFSNPIAKKVYQNLGFTVDDTLIMFNKPKE